MSGDLLSDHGIWFRVESSSAASAVRRAAERLGTQLELGASRTADLAIVAAELTSNLVKHAEEGSLLLRPVRRSGRAGVELIAIDSGPGMADLTVSSRDGHSTTGTLGIGLGAIARQASWFDGYSLPGRGTVLAVQVWSGPAPEPSWAGGLTRPITGEQVSGDGYAVRVAEGRHQVLVCDGLGHGPLAAAATDAAFAAFRAAPAGPPGAVVLHLHRAMSHTRGAALAVAELDPAAGLLRYAGLGNIAAMIVVGGERRRSLVSLPGIAGHRRPAVREYDYPWQAGATLVMHSDGVVDRWDLADYPGLDGRAPLVTAATLLRDAGIRRDDACVLVARAES
ncbi:Anti-sigma regulatory factor (Ser/Thr protein kinase) [Micromonospora rhizosphaerae]|uniref:Anti-sigma regulatory factor (Ser/Thr protein kinase) n=1 Tax=Micromonospora rhizosphaerae TaxID=568872 RepID=A0A1C6RIP6_9ACTN|nr:SpoIIE family protein phosphatase [Micromonospora rhizosphaerae]SCL16885.1 Anti-sigma regulatory factor (Ser/Thr protein kinase) [Micromonospora rhizosphaerae]